MMQLNTDKIIFTGPVGAGKTTAIASISDTPPVNTDVNTSGEERRIKESTTVAMDYSYIEMEDGTKVHLYGTPGQSRFDFMWKILTNGGLGLVLLINNDHPEPIKQMEFYLDSFSDFINKTGVVIGITRTSIKNNASIEDYQTKLFERNQIFPVFEVDSRSEDDIKILIQALLAILAN
ncbi:putative ATP/GTP-binding protein [hydrothermal vent metagenome]|uniref:Putative ATP/GTP-binding protein n=1 Tax=hydrothermal vent metagenome TaxID=652676 RepID=A0A3B1AKU8_9ZZZZ